MTLAEEWKILQDTQALWLLGVSFICGALIGAEREFARKPAGLRTNIMICVGSTLYTLASVYCWKFVASGVASVDPGRIAAQIVSGVGFIGAGVVLRTNLQVTGVTTAATVWFAAAVGILVGFSFPLLGALVSFGCALTLFTLALIERKLPISKKPSLFE